LRVLFEKPEYFEKKAA